MSEVSGRLALNNHTPMVQGRKTAGHFTSGPPSADCGDEIVGPFGHLPSSGLHRASAADLPVVPCSATRFSGSYRRR